MNSARPLAVASAFLALLLMLAALGVRYWASERAYSRTGPTHIAASSEQVVVFADGRFFVLDAQGEIVSSTERSAAGLTDDPIDLLFLESGQLLVAEQQPARIWLCRPSGWNCDFLPLDSEHAPRRQLKLVEAGDDGLWVSDAAGDMLLWYVPDTGLLEPRVERKLLAGPNGMVLEDSGRLWIADTDNRRLLELINPDDFPLLQAGREHSTVNEVTLGDRHFPMLMARGPNGRLWLTLADDFSGPASDLAVYDQQEGALFTVELPGSRFATDLVRFGDQILVTDMDAARIYRIDATRVEVQEFGGTAFQAEMAALLASQQQFHFISRTALVGVISFAVLMILAAAWATPRGKRWTPPVDLFDPDEVTADVTFGNGIHWLQRRDHVERMVRWLGVAAIAAAVLLFASLLFLYAWIHWQTGPDSAELKQEQGTLLLLIAVVLGCFAASIPMFRAVSKSLRRRLGTDGKKLYIRMEDGRSLVIAPEQLFYTPRSLLYRQYSMPLKDGRMQSLYEEGEIRAYLAPLLLRGKRLTPMQGLAHQWRNRDKVLIASIIGSSVILLLALLLAFYS